MHFRSARSGQGRAFRTAKRTLDGEDRSGIVRGGGKGDSATQLSWLQAWHIRDETYSAALAEVVNALSRAE